jgi:hypothetical protein
MPLRQEGLGKAIRVWQSSSSSSSKMDDDGEQA